MKFITTVDHDWHPMNVEMPSHTISDLELLQPDGTIITAEIMVDMAGWYVYLNPGWGSLDDYTHWRFKENHKYYL